MDQLQKLRPLGRSEQLSAVSHELGFFQNVGMSAHYSSATSFELSDLKRTVYAALARVIREHAILSSIPVNEGSPDVYFARLPVIDLARCVSFISRTQGGVQDERDIELDKILEEQHNTGFKADYGALPFWRIVILLDVGSESSFTASFIFHHGIGDGAAGLIFHKAFGAALNHVSSSVNLDDDSPRLEVSDNVRLLPPLEEIHPLPINENPAPFRTEGLQEWIGNPISLPCKSHYRSLYISSSSTTNFAQKCKENRLTLTAGLYAIVGGALFSSLPSSVEALTGIIPVNLRPWIELSRDVADNAIGSFIDAIKVQVRRSDFDAHERAAVVGLPAAQHTSQEIHNYLTANPSPSGEPYTSVAFFKGIPDVSAAFKAMVGTNRDAAFEVSNLGRFKGDSQTPSDLQWRTGRMTFSRGAVVFGAAVTTSVVSGADGALTISFSWQEGVVEDCVVDAVVDSIRLSF